MGKCPGMRWLGLMVDVFSEFWGVSMLSFIMTVLVYIPTISGLMYLSPDPYQHLLFWILDKCPSNWGEMKPHCAWICSSLMANDFEHFHMSVGHSYFILWKLPVHDFCPKLNWIFFNCLVSWAPFIQDLNHS